MMGRVLALTLIALVMQSSTTIYYYGWVRHDQIYPGGTVTGWDVIYQYSNWFYYFGFLSCAILVWLIYKCYRMRIEEKTMSHGQWQELAVISIGLWLMFLPGFIYYSIGFIDDHILNDRPDSGGYQWEAYETLMYYYHLGLLFTFTTYLLIGLLAMRRYKRTLPIEVVPLEGPAMPPPIEAPDDLSLHED